MIQCLMGVSQTLHEALHGDGPGAAQPPPEAPAPLAPPLKWAGGKRWLLPHLRPLWAPCAERRLVEPFAGGLAVALGLAPGRALLNDINAPAINFYRWLQRGLTIRIPMRNEAELYYRHRDDFNRLVTGRWGASKKAAELFYYLNRTGYNGLCRFNRRGEFNVPFGRYARIRYRRSFPGYARALAGWELSDLHFTRLALEPRDFIYADPPYDVPFRAYSADDFGWDEQVRLAHWLAAHPGPVAASNQATARVVELYRDLGFTLRFLDGPRHISCTGDRRPAREVLALRNLPHADGPL